MQVFWFLVCRVVEYEYEYEYAIVGLRKNLKIEIAPYIHRRSAIITYVVAINNVVEVLSSIIYLVHPHPRTSFSNQQYIIWHYIKIRHAWKKE
jgi:hypothetical protein